MSDYLRENHEYWQQGYYAPNVESYVFRMWGHVLKYEFLDVMSRKTRMVDFGCGQGAALAYFNRLGFDVYGVDISETDIEICRKSMPDISDHFAIIPSEPRQDDVWFGGGYDLVTAFQSLYYYDNDDMKKRIESLYNQMKPRAVICATMMGTKCGYYEHSRPYKNGLRTVAFENSRFSVDNYNVNFIDSKEELLDIFSPFEKMHIGYYDSCFREDEGCHFHWTYIGKKGES